METPTDMDMMRLSLMKGGGDVSKYRDPKTTKIEDWKWRKMQDVRKDMPIIEVPDYVQKNYGEFMNQQLARAQAAGLTTRDLLKAFTITQSSIGRGGLSHATATKTGMKLPNTGDEVRPEGAFAEWLGSPMGQSYLNAAERGMVHQPALNDVRQKFSPFGKHNQLTDQMIYAAQNMPAMSQNLNQAITGSKDDYRDFAEKMKGVAGAKSGFIGSMLGRGDLPTLDARQLNLHSLPANVGIGSIMNRGKGKGAREAVDRLASRQSAMNLKIDPAMQPHYQHLAHHAVWDASGNNQTTHNDIIKAMRGYAEGGDVNPFDYENPEHVTNVAGHISKHKDFNKIPDVHKHMGEMLSAGTHKYLEDPRVQQGMRKAGHNAYYVREKTGKKMHPLTPSVIKKAVGGAVPSVNEMRAELATKNPTSLSDMTKIGAKEAPNMNVKEYLPPKNDGTPMPIGGVDMSQLQEGHQLLPQSLVPKQPPEGQPPQGAEQEGMPSPLGGGAPPPQAPSNILQMTPQGQAMNAMTPPKPPPKMAGGGSVSSSWMPDNNEPLDINDDNLLKDGGSVGDEDDSTVMTHEHGYADGGMVPEEMEPPKKTVKAYKLFRVHKKHPGKLFPLFVNADKPVEMDKWQQAEIGEMAGKKVKSKIGPLAFRPGWHAGDLPIATHIGEKDEEQKMEQARIRELRNKAVKKHGDKKLANQTYPYPEWTNAPRLRNPNHVWAEVDMPNDKNWQKEADNRGMNAQGKIIAKNAHITDQIPHGGHYRYKTNSNMKGNWLIGGGMKVNRILSDDEVKSINKTAGAKDLPRAKKQKLSEYGFASGGSAQGEKAKKPTVAEMKEAIFQQAQKDLMLPSEALGKHEGKYMHITEADRAKVEKRKHGMRGGVGFSQIGLEDPEYAGRVWGVGRSGTAIKLLNRERRGLNPEDQSIWTTFIGTPEMHTSNQLVFNRMWNKFQEAKKAGLLNPEQEAKMLDIIRSAMTKGNAKNPSKPVFDPDVSFDNTHHLFDTFERRRILSDLMAGNKIGGKKAQIFDASKMIEDTTDPRLLHAPSMSVGPHVFEFNRKTSLEPNLNKAFPFMLHGTAHPEAFRQIPFTEAAPDFSNEIRQTKGREPGYMDIVRRIPRQQITEKYLTGLQKKGYKKGGKVNLSTNMDIMNLELSRKSKKAK